MLVGTAELGFPAVAIQHECQKLNSGPLQKPCAVLGAEPSLQSLKKIKIVWVLG